VGTANVERLAGGGVRGCSWRRGSPPLPARYIRPLPELSVGLALPDALERMRGGKAPIAQVVADGASRGIATLDDLLAHLIRP
jgi:hypothetical protein